MARPKSGEAMVTICTRVPESVRDELVGRAARAGRPPAELHRDVMVAAMALDGTTSDLLRAQPDEVGLTESQRNEQRAAKGLAPVHTPTRTSVARTPAKSSLKGKTFRGPFPKGGGS